MEELCRDLLTPLVGKKITNLKHLPDFLEYYSKISKLAKQFEKDESQLVINSKKYYRTNSSKNFYPFPEKMDARIEKLEEELELMNLFLLLSEGKIDPHHEELEVELWDLLTLLYFLKIETVSEEDRTSWIVRWKELPKKIVLPRYLSSDQVRWLKVYFPDSINMLSLPQ